LDIAAAFLLALSNGRDPIRVLEFIASGVFGLAAFSEGWYYPTLGVLFHYVISMIWSVAFFLVFEKIRSIRKKRILMGILMGCFVWVVMNQVVLPLSNTPPIPFNLKSAITGAAVLIGAIGLPISFLAARFFRQRDSETEKKAMRAPIER
jgi:uncharacterized membrane protein YagU involved in acid resistance